MKKTRYTKKKKKISLNLFKSPARPYIAGFPLQRGAFYNKLFSWPTMEEINQTT